MHGRLRSLASLCLALGALAPGCRKEAPTEERFESFAATPPRPEVARCEAGIRKALTQQTHREVTRTFYEECADLHQKPVCRDAWKQAAAAPGSEQQTIVADACARAYCPDLSAYSLSLCQPGAERQGPSLSRTWPPLFDAIMAREAGEYVAEMTTALMVLYVHTKRLEAAGDTGEAPSAPPAGASADA
ncbi:MAG: hypothetical protein FJ104_00585, partial [Deltaproteobacteria bacterium]|nr:hypothetical protein [Deltaproteobacteria bacterium]